MPAEPGRGPNPGLLRKAGTPNPAAAVLTIAGSDSSGGAGIQGDLATLRAFGVHGTSAVTCVTAQNSRGVHGWWPLPVEAVRAQIRAVLDDIGAGAVKVGMLGTAAVAAAVADELAAYGGPVVVDPVCASSYGDPLLDPDALTVLREQILPLATVVTPNLAEAALIGPVGCWLLVTGGHADGPATDVLTGPGGRHEFTAERVGNPHAHGTGCALSSAIAARLALGDDVPAAVAAAKEYVTAAIRGGYPLGGGIGPVSH